MGKLSKKAARFSHEFCIDLNATQAAIRAGYSEKTAYSIANYLLKKVEIQERIAENQKRISESCELSAAKVLNELSRIAFCDVTDYVTFGRGKFTIKDSTSLTKDQTACIQEVSKTTTRGGSTIKFSLHDKLRAIEMLGRHLGLFTDKFQVNGMLNGLSDGQVDELYNKILKQLTNNKSNGTKSKE